MIGLTVLLIVVTVLSVIFLLPIRVKAFFGEGKWSVSVYYVLFRVFHREKKPEPPPSSRPPRPDDAEDADTEIVPLKEISPLQATKPPEYSAQSEQMENPEESETPSVKEETKEENPDTSSVEEETKAENARASSVKEESESSKTDADEKPKRKGFFARLVPHSLSDFLGLAEDILTALSPSLKFLLRHFHFRNVKLYLAVGSDEPAKTAKLYGMFSAAVYHLLGALQSCMDFAVEECRILADFFGEKLQFRAEMELRCSPAALLLTVLILGVKFLWKSCLRLHEKNQEEKRRAREQAFPSAVKS